MSVDWMSKGEDSAKVFEQEKAAQEKRRQEQGKAFRFYLKETKKGSGVYEEAPLLFVDGDLGPKGYLIPPRFYEHGYIFHQGDYHNIVCPEQTLPHKAKEDPSYKCPLCEAGDKPYLASLFTVLDLRPYKSEKTGKVIEFTRKLFVAKPQTFELLNKLAAKRGGLGGCRFDVSRSNKKSPQVGDVFDFQEKLTDLAALKAKYTISYTSKKDGKEENVVKCLFEKLDYEKEIIFRTGDELRKMGFGSPSSSMPTQADTAVAESAAAEGAGQAKDYAADL